MPNAEDLIIDAFHGGALPEQDPAALRAAGRRRPDAGAALARVAKPQILARMLLNLQRVYVQMTALRARDVEPLLAVNPSATRLRERGMPPTT
jgi:regulator of sirC expression with transglutaminase-like and TPR domain